MALARFSEQIGVQPHDAPALGNASARAEVPELTEAGHRPSLGVLIVGMGDETRGDGGVGVHLTGCLSQMSWPAGVHFCRADRTVPTRAGHYGRVILLDSMEGPQPPGSLYRIEVERLLPRSANQDGFGLGLLAMLPPTVRRRVDVFGVQPASTRYRSPLSRQVVAALPVLLPYLRTYILKTAAELAKVN